MFLYEFLSNGQKIQQWHWGKENCCGGRKVKAVEIYFLKKKKKKKSCQALHRVFYRKEKSTYFKGLS